MTSQHPATNFPGRDILEQFARDHAVLFGEAPKTHR